MYFVFFHLSIFSVKRRLLFFTISPIMNSPLKLFFGFEGMTSELRELPQPVRSALLHRRPLPYGISSRICVRAELARIFPTRVSSFDQPPSCPIGDIISYLFQKPVSKGSPNTCVQLWSTTVLFHVGYPFISVSRPSRIQICLG